MKGLNIAFFFIVFGVTFSNVAASAPTIITVKDAEMGGPLPFAHIYFSSSKQSKRLMVLTDNQGKATLENHPELGDTLYIKISYMGFTPVEDTLVQGSQKTYKLYPKSANLQQVVITGELTAGNPERSLHKVSIISAEKIEAMNAVTLDQVLSRELNMNIEQSGIFGSNISINGLSGENVKILIDGVPMVGRLNGSIDLSQINLNDIERIEVIEGPLSVAYGSNALAGTINLITKKGSQKPFSANVNSYNESVGTYNVNGNVSLKKGKNFGAVSGFRNFFNGWNEGDQPFNSPPLKGDSNRAKAWNPRTQVNGGVKYGRNIKNGSVIYSGNYFNEVITNRGLPRGPYKEVAFDDKYHTTRLDNSVNLNLTLDTFNNIIVLGAYNKYKRERLSYLTDLTGVSSELNPAPGASDTTHTELIMLRSTFTRAPRDKNFTYQVGIDLNNEHATGERIKDQEQAIGDYAMFGNFEWKPSDKWTVRPGMRVSYNTKYGAPVIPSLNLKYQISNGFALRGAVARGFRAPSVKELYMEFVDVNHNLYGNTNLKAETALHTSLNMTWSALYRARLMKMKAGVFYNNIQDKITLAQINAVEYSYQNVSKAVTMGFNTELEYHIGHLKSTVGFSYIGTENTISESDAPSKMAFTPQVTTTLGYGFKEIGLDVNLFYKFNGKSPQFVLDDQQQLQQQFINSYALLDFNVHKQLFSKHLVLGVGVKNILNVTNVATNGSGGAHSGNATSLPIAPGRVYFVKLGVQF